MHITEIVDKTVLVDIDLLEQLLNLPRFSLSSEDLKHLVERDLAGLGLINLEELGFHGLLLGEVQLRC